GTSAPAPSPPRRTRRRSPTETTGPGRTGGGTGRAGETLPGPGRGGGRILRRDAAPHPALPAARPLLRAGPCTADRRPNGVALDVRTTDCRDDRHLDLLPGGQGARRRRLPPVPRGGPRPH